MIKLSVLCIFYQVLVLGVVGARGADPNLQFDLTSNPLLPSDCSGDLSARIAGGRRAFLGQFPWMAMLIYGTPKGDSTNCGGALINHRYVLTAAHCVGEFALQKGWHLKAVRLGEYNLNKNPDCANRNGRRICAPDVVDVGVEKQIVHESFDPRNSGKRHDIALLRLNRTIPYTHFIQPICLPPNDDMGEDLVAAGWGMTEYGHWADILRVVVLPVFDKQECVRIYRNDNVTIGHGQMCAGGENGRDSCGGDSGGPLMNVEVGSDDAETWTVVGIVSFGPQRCGVPGWPGVYTKVIDFVPWILSKLEP